MISNLNNVTINCGVDFSPSAIGIPAVFDNEDLDPNLQYRDEPVQGCILIRRWIAMDDAGNVATVSQSVRFSSPQAPMVRSPNSIAVACGSIEDARTNLAHNNISVYHPCSRPVTTTYTDSADVTQCGFTFSRIWVVQDDCGISTTFVQIIRVLDQSLPDSPENGLINARLDEPLFWPQFPGATAYKVYIWMASADRPTEPIAVTNTRSFYPSTNYPPGTRYFWRIEYITTENMTIPSPIWGFETEPFPDLQVTDVIAAPFAFSGQSFQISWTVINNGNLSININWHDRIYIGRTTDFFDSRSVQIIRQNRFLDINDGYSSQAEVNLNENDIGTFYAFVVTDAFFRVRLI